MVQRLDYQVVRSYGAFELRRYPLTILATVRGMDDYEAFSILFDYISGGNRRKQKVAMTAPVLSDEGASERIPMAVPIVSGTRSFSFVLPPSYSPTDVPEPLDPRVVVEVVPGRELAVMRFRGRTGERKVSERSQALMDVVAWSGLSARGSPFLMRYNPPFTPGFLRRNEVAIEVKPGQIGQGPGSSQSPANALSASSSMK